MGLQNQFLMIQDLRRSLMRPVKPLSLVAALFFLIQHSDAFAQQKLVPQFLDNSLGCSGIMFNLDRDDEKNLPQTIEMILGKSWRQEWQLNKVETQIHPDVLSFDLNKIGDNTLQVNKAWNIVYRLQEGAPFDVELKCDASDEMTAMLNEVGREQEQKELKSLSTNAACESISEKDLEENPAYKTCDTLWPLKMVGLLQQKSNGEWSDDWLVDLLITKQQKLLEEANLYDSKNNYLVSSRLRLMASQMMPFGDGVLIGHPDTGFTDHPELDALEKVDAPINFAGGFFGAYDSFFGMAPGHGTSTASVIVSPDFKQDNEKSLLRRKNLAPVRDLYVRGVAKGARIRPYRVANGTVIHFLFTNVIAALNTAGNTNYYLTKNNDEDTTKRIRLVSMSLGGPLPRKRLYYSLQYANAQGIIPIAAAGNKIPRFIFNKFVVWPAHYNNVLAVAAVDVNQNPWEDSSKGVQVDIAAPGHEVWRARSSKVAGREYFDVQRSSGTSYATAIVAGIVAIWEGFHGEEKMKEYESYRLDLLKYIIAKSRQNGELGQIRCDQFKMSCQDISLGHYGPGIINLKAVLNVELPTLVELKRWINNGRKNRDENNKSRLGMFSGKAISNLDNLTNLFSDYPREHVLATLYRVFKLNAGEEENFLEKYTDEIIYHLINRQDVYAEMLRQLDMKFLDTSEQLLEKVKDEASTPLLVLLQR
jgi:subtilisin family serine protease